MNVTSIVFNDNAKPLRNNTFIDIGHVGHRGVRMKLLDGGIVSVIFPEPNYGSYGIPISSLSHVKFEEAPSPVASVASPKKKPKKKPQLPPRVSA